MNNLIPPNLAPPDTGLNKLLSIPPQIQLTFIKPNVKGLETVSFANVEDAEAYAYYRNQLGYNVFFTVNKITSTAPQDFKPKKSDIQSITHAHLDLDPEGGDQYQSSHEALYNSVDDFIERLQASFVIKSGHGIQVFWEHETPLSIDDGEAINKRLINQYGGDKGTWNADRLMRVPFTFNYPDQVKIAKGYPIEPQFSEVIYGV